MVSLFTSVRLIHHLVRQVFPAVNQELADWQTYAASLSEPELSAQALSSLRDKKFHCQGGCVYSLYNGIFSPPLLRLIVSLQTISDYLDNLCDRVGMADEQAFRQLHFAMVDALTPGATLRDYYRYYPFKKDEGYLAALVHTCQEEIAGLPAYSVVKTQLLTLAGLYSELQTYKHLHPSIRDQKMAAWTDRHLSRYPDLLAGEFAAASGSTLGIFALCAAAADPCLSEDTANKISSAYFPWISGLHILLDYFIDREEDRQNGDLNFLAYYADDQETLTRLTLFWQKSLEQLSHIPNPAFTKTVIRGLLGMYLSDPKANAYEEMGLRDALLAQAGSYTRFIYALCRLLRTKKLL